MRVIVVSSLALAAWVLLPYIPWLVVAAWIANIARPAVQRLSRRLGGRERAASLLVFLVLVVLVAPISFVVATLVQDIRHVFADSPSGAGSLLTSLGTSPSWSARDATLRDWFVTHGRETMSILGGVTVVAAEVGSGLFVLVAGIYVCITEGSRAYAWFLLNAPIADRHIERFSDAFQETGRGLLVGIGLIGLLQASIATTTYFALGVPRAALMGLATFLAAAIPSIGTALVWIPIAIVMALHGQKMDALILTVVGVVFVSTAGNLLRPRLARWAKLDLHPFVVLVAMFGGVAALGGWGILLGPLCIRLAMEALRIARSEQMLPSVQ